LIKEFKGETQKRINIYRADIFLEMANKNLAQQTTKEAILEVRNIRLADELEFISRANTKLPFENANELPLENITNNEAKKSTAFEQAISDLVDENKDKKNGRHIRKRDQ